MELSELEELIRKSLDAFYQRRINKLSGLKLKDTLRKKNPYLFAEQSFHNLRCFLNSDCPELHVVVR